MTPQPQHPAPGTRLLSYVRFSSKPQERGQSVERQVALARKYAEDYRLKLDTSTHADLGVSAFRGSNLKAGSALHALVSAVEAGKIPKGSVIGFESLDRWSRSAPLDALNSLQRVLRKGVGIVTLGDRRYWTMDALKDLNGLLSAVLTMSRSHEESAVKSDRLRAVWASKRKRAAVGTVHTRMSPGWLSWSGKAWDVDQRKAKAVLRVFQMTAEGHGATAIARTFNKEKVPVPTRRGDSWHGSTIHKLLHSPAVIGILQVGHRETAEDGSWKRVVDQDVPTYYPAVVTRRLWLKTRRAARPRIPPGPRSATVNNLFSGLLVCGACRGRLHYVNKGSAGAFYTCAKARRGLCKSVRSWPAQRFEKLLLTLLSGLIRWETLIPSARARAKSTLTTLEEQLAHVEVERSTVATKLRRLVEAVESGARVPTLVQRITALESEQNALKVRSEELHARLEVEKDRSRSAAADVQESRAALEVWKAGKLSKDPTARHRLSVVLRQMLSRVVLTTPEGTRYGPSSKAYKPRHMEVVFADGARSDDFLVPSDLSAVYDPHDGSQILKLAE